MFVWRCFVFNEFVYAYNCTNAQECNKWRFRVLGVVWGIFLPPFNVGANGVLQYKHISCSVCLCPVCCVLYWNMVCSIYDNCVAALFATKPPTPRLETRQHKWGGGGAARAQETNKKNGIHELLLSFCCFIYACV